MPGPFARRLAEVAAGLNAHRDLWHPRPFAERHMPWEDAHPEVAAWLDARPDDEFDLTRFGPDDPHAAGAPPSLVRWRAAADALADLPRLPALPFALGAKAARGIGGAKRAQIEAFVGCFLAGFSPPGSETHVLDWCAGKGHLGRALAEALGRPLRAIEWDATLCDAGAALARAQGLEADFEALDARSTAAAARVRPDAAAVALHACGDLHGALLRAATAHGVSRLAVSPCCYNRTPPGTSVLLSAAGRATGLVLDADDLDLVHRLPTAGGAAERRRVRQTLGWRLGFDLWHREASGRDAYRRMPAFPPAWLALPFAEFAVRFAGLGGVEHIPGREVGAYETQGVLRLARALRREAVRLPFARALEAFLLLDRASLLEAAGFDVALGTFCGLDETPRNGLLLARRP
ncbi:SAM-dependent methyltransferase [Myxococcota bacterium]|nr:SAM-dependent methyltransferase [Myxococcota bacterium]